MDARGFSCWIQLTIKPRATAAKRRLARTVGTPNPVTGKTSPGLGYAPSTVAHSEPVLRKCYDLHRDAGSRPPPTRTASTPDGAATTPTSRPRKAIWPPSSTSPPAAWSAGPPPTTCGPSWSPTLSSPPAVSVVPPGPWSFTRIVLSVHQSAIRLSSNRVGRPSVRRPHRAVLGQRACRVVLRHHQTGVARHHRLAQPGRRPHRDLRLHRGLVQLAPAAQQPQLPSPAEYETALAV